MYNWIEMSTIDFNALRDRAYKTACEHGFHDEELSNEHYLMLVITELSEAVEADRKNKRTSSLDLAWAKSTVDESHLLEEHFPEKIKDAVEDELADAVIRLLDLSGLRGIDLSSIERRLCPDRFKEVFELLNASTFTELVFSFVRNISNCSQVPNMIGCGIDGCFALAYFYDIDLLWHIETKMRYNEHRPKMHGKKY